MNNIYGSKISGIKPCPYCSSENVVLANPFYSSNNQILDTPTFTIVSLFVFCEECLARGRSIGADVSKRDKDFVTNLLNAKREAIESWNSVKGE